MNKIFTVEESNLISIFASENRTQVIQDISNAIPHLDDEEWHCVWPISWKQCRMRSLRRLKLKQQNKIVAGHGSCGLYPVFLLE